MCEARTADDLERSLHNAKALAPNELVSIFVTPDDGLKVQDRFALDADKGKLVGATVPNFFFVNSASQGKQLSNRTMRDFVGLDTNDQTTTSAMLEFSYFLTIGNVDEAFRAVQSIKSPAVWHNMARMCVSSKRIDVATVCMGNMRDVVGARALREAQKEPELEARIAALAIHLGLGSIIVSTFGSCLTRFRHV